MLWMALNWTWVFVSIYIVGFCVCRRINHDEFWSDGGVRLIAGILITGTFAQIYALFRPLGMDAYLAHAVAVLLVAAFSWKNIKAEIVLLFQKSGEWNIGFILFAAAVVTCFLRLATLPSVNYDDYLYHIQQIRWIQGYGTVFGLGNIHSRLAFTSGMLHLQGLYSWSHIPQFDQGVYGFVGWFSCVLFLYGTYYLTRCKCGGWENAASKIVAVVILIYLMGSFRAIAGLCTDICPNLFVLFIYLHWFQILERNEEALSRYIFLCVCAAYGMTLNLSSASTVFLCLIPMFLCMKRRKVKEGVCLVCGMGAAVMPMLARNVIQSGYLLWPSRFLDVFSFKWKVPLGAMEDYAYWVTLWARLIQLHMDGLTHDEIAGMPFGDWFPFWFRMQGREMKILVILSTVLIVVVLVLFAIRLARKEEVRAADLTSLVVVFSVLFWIYMAPDARFGSNTMWILAAMGSHLASEFDRARLLGRTVSCFAVCAMCVKLVLGLGNFGSEKGFLYMPPRFDEVYPYAEVNVYSDAGNSIVIYVNTSDDRQGYDVFPASPYPGVVSGVKLLGNDISDGFYSATNGH